ncbi:MAG: Trk system potassium transporter TrkA [Firmicutes bacterium]|nr:Trk system potassium transporter TrkA [Bacillota bacterium]
MNIVIVGCGKVGSVLAEQLSKENHEVTVIDSNSFKIERMQEKLDIQGVVGNGSSYQVQLTAGLKHADLLIAVTSKDEINLLSCLIARKGGHCHTIARVRDNDYYHEINIIKEELGLSMFVNPEREAAREIARLIQVPSALELDVFAKGRVNMVCIKVGEKSVLDGMRILDVRTKINPDVLACIIERGSETIIPKGGDFIRTGDNVSFIVPISEMTRFFQRIGVVSKPIKNVMIAGGSSVAYYLAEMLSQAKISVKIIEQNKERCEYLAEKLEDVKVIYGDATNQDLLHEEEIDKTDAFVSLTNMDEENIMLSLYANEVSKAKLITKINKITFNNVIKNLSIGSVISPKNIIAERIIRYVRTMQNSRGSNIETLYRINDKAEAIEFKVKETQKDIINIPIMELKIKEDILICAINHNGRIFSPGGKDTIQAGDNVIVVTTGTGLEDISRITEKA